MTHEGVVLVLMWALVILAGLVALGAVIYSAVLLALDTHAQRETRRQLVK